MRRESLNIAINGIISEGDHVISTDMEHNSVLRPLYRLQAEKKRRTGFRAGRPRRKNPYRRF
jgi:selenocysteine lyase/cysteine desulfurase